MKRIFFALLIFASATMLFGKNISLVSTLNPSNFELLDVEIEGSKMIIPAGLGGAVLYDISDPTLPRELSSIFLPACIWRGRSYNWDIQNTIAIETNRECGMGIVDITDPTRPNLRKMLNPAEENFNRKNRTGQISLEDVEIVNNIAIFAAHTDGLLFYDISDPADPKFISQITTANAWSVAVNEPLAYVADGDSGLTIVNFSKLQQPEIIANHATSGTARDIRFKNGTVFLAVGGSGVDVYDVTSPEQPTFLDNFITSGFASRVAVDGNFVSVSAWNALQVLNWNGSTLELYGYKNTGGRVMAVGSPGGNIVYSAEWQFLRVMQVGPVNGPDIDLDTRVINFSHLQTGQSETAQLQIQNNGQENLEFSGIGITHPDFSTSPVIQVIEPGQETTLDILYTAIANNARGTMEIVSNDPDENRIRVSLAGNSTFGVDIGIPAPEFDLPVVANGSGTINLQELKDQVVVLAMFATW